MVWTKLKPGIYAGLTLPPIDEELLQIRIRLSNLPPGTKETRRFHTWVERPEVAQAFNLARQFIFWKPPHHFFTMAGPPGVGKTHLGIATLWEWLELGLGNGCYYQTEAMLEHLRSLYRASKQDTEGSQRHDIEWFKGCGLLIMDDLGVEKESDWSTAKLDEIIDHRYLNQKPTIFSLNVKPEALPPRVYDRIREGQIVIMKTTSYRPEKAKERS